VRRAAALLLLVATGLSGMVNAEDPDAQSLRGIKTVSVVIEKLGSDATATGLDLEELRTTSELALRRDGIRVVNGPSSPYVYVNVNLVAAGANCAASTSIEVKQGVTLGDGDFAVATTWSSTGVSVGGCRGIADQVRTVLRQNLDRLSNAYLSVNPKK